MTQLSDQEEYAFAFSTSMQQNTNDFFQLLDTSAVEQNTIENNTDFFQPMDTMAVQQNTYENTNDFSEPLDTSAVATAESMPEIAEPMVYKRECMILHCQMITMMAL